MQLLNKPFILIRHGETPLNRDRLIGGRTDVSLTSKGRAQAEKTRSLLAQYEFDAVITSTLTRAKETADILFPHAHKIIIAGLKERDWGDLEMKPQSLQTPYEETPPNGESWGDFCQRIVDALNLILQQYEQPVVVAHSGVFRVIWQLALGSPYGERVGNVEPYFICASDENQPWKILSLLQLEKEI